MGMGTKALNGHQAARVSAGVLALAATLALALTTASDAPGSAPSRHGAEAVPPYGTNDAGGFRNVLPPGEAGTDNVTQFAEFNATGAYPPHWTDQQPLYDDLIQGAQGLTNSGISRYYKDATFGVKPADVESTTNPRTGVTIIRDKQFGVPHIYGMTRADTMFGTGYAGAQDRLFLMDILRHTGRAQLSSFVGGSPSNRAMDRDQWQFAPYTEADLQKQIDEAGKFYGDAGRKLVADVKSYVAGINAYIADAKDDPRLMPAEYAALGKLPQPWKPTDVVAEASLIGGIFGKGGGRELDAAQLMQAFQERFGRKAGRRAWRAFRSKNDPEAPTTVSERFPYETTSPFAKRGLALPDPGSVHPAPVAPSLGADASSTAQGEFANVGAELMQALQVPHASNWELISARESRTGHPIGVLGPQVGYYDPQILMEMDVHGPGIDARGATFPGVNLYVLLGHGRDYAWSATTATSDNVDTFAEVLCRDDFHYRYKGRCLPMEKLVRTNTWTTTGPGEPPSPGSETLTAYRTVHGIVYARGNVDGKDVAFVSARSTYFHEADSALFFAHMNDPHFMRNGPDSFRRAAKQMNFAFNWSYLDSKHIAYYLTGWYPKRARGTSPDFPILGTGQYDWRGFDPSTHTADFLPIDRHPHAVDPRYLVSWNNKQAPGWAAADDQYDYGPIHRSQLISDGVRRSIRGGREASLAQLVKAMEEPATQDLRAVKLLPLLKRAIGHPKSAKLRRALHALTNWRKAGAHRRDLNQDGQYEDTGAVALMDAWWPLLVRAEFEPALGKTLFGQAQDMLPAGDHTRGDPTAPDFFDGWWGYVSKDLRSVFGPDPRGAWPRRYCGGGSKSKCRAALRGSLREALKVEPATLYGHGDCEDDPDPQCFDQNRSVITSAISIPPAPFQNRPTFQQTVSVRKNLP
jgi:acyl-homoserine lactone acylase PvdQ